MITVEQAIEFLESIGADNVPSFVVAAIVEDANGINECLEKHYSPAVATLIQCYMIAIIGSMGADKYISSQTAPSGASQSFRYKNTSLGDLFKLLRARDIHGCTIGIVPPDPTVKAFGGMFVVTGGCYE